MLCLTDTGGGNYQVSDPQPTELNGCTYLLVQPTELPPDWYQLTAEQGLQIGGAMLLVWAIAWCYRAVIRVLNIDERFENETNH